MLLGEFFRRFGLQAVNAVGHFLRFSNSVSEPNILPPYHFMVTFLALAQTALLLW